MKKYAIPRYVEEETFLFKGSIKQWGAWIPFLVVGLSLFFSLTGVSKIMLPCLTMGIGYVLCMVKIDRETNGERLKLCYEASMRQKRLHWEYGGDFRVYRPFE